jgi:hypothetical protein
MKLMRLTPHEIGVIELAAGRYPATEVARWLGRGHNTVLRQMRRISGYRPVKGSRPFRYLWLDMEVGDKRLVNYATNRKVRNAAASANRRYGQRYGYRYTTKITLRGTLIKRVS